MLSLLIALPTITYNNSLWVIQMLLGEFSWIPLLTGVMATGLGAMTKRKSLWGIILGLFAIVWSIIPFWQVRTAAKLNDAAMREGLGNEYLRVIPPVMRARIAQARWSPETSFGSRTRSRSAACSIEQDVVYVSTPQRTLMCDIYRPKVKPAIGDKYPAVIVIHGGAWRYGDKGEVFVPHNRYLASLGYVVFDVQYRLSEEARWNAPLEDLRSAIAWVKHYALAHQIDPARIALLGRSAGGHLALLAAYRAHEDTTRDTSVAAVVGLYAPTDMRLWMSDDNSEVTRFLGGNANHAAHAYRDASPTEFVTNDLPPTLLAIGYRDDLVMPTHGELLHNKLLATNSPVVTLRLPWARHGFDAFLSGLGAQIAQYDIDRFLAWSLYGKPHRRQDT
ncbi:MAG: alpha/beta hydrolase [Chloroflexota bacterium]|nr:alpha/beta hydrolase [Chloroflexota bacterium]